jgi:hypothetical protein
MTTGVARADEPARPQPSSVVPVSRVLRWTYRRDDERLTCELSLTADYAAYELRIHPARAAHGASEQFHNAIAAFERQSALENALVRDGWYLDQFEQARL